MNGAERHPRARRRPSSISSSMQRPGRRCNRVADTSKFPKKGRIDFDKTGREIAENPYISAPRLAIAGKQFPQPSAKTMRPSAPALLTRRVIRVPWWAQRDARCRVHRT